MKTLIRFAVLGAAPFALAACGDSDDASDDIEADSVEMPANEALEPVTEGPVVDEAGTAREPEGPPAVSQQTAEDAADRAAKVAAEAAAAAEAAEAAANIPVE